MFAVICISVAAWFFNTISPEQGRGVQSIGVVFLTLIPMLVVASVTNNVRRISIIGVGAGAFFTLRMFQLFDILYYALLILFLFTLNLAIKKANNG